MKQKMNFIESLSTKTLWILKLGLIGLAERQV